LFQVARVSIAVAPSLSMMQMFVVPRVIFVVPAVQTTVDVGLKLIAAT
jgi:hypothetical protein